MMHIAGTMITVLIGNSMRCQNTLQDRCIVRKDVTRLDGARGKKQVWRPHVWTWGLSEANLLYWRKYLWHCWDFSAPP